MVTKKDLVIAVLTTFCLTASLFMIVPTSGTLSTYEYDPWMDVNDDGINDITDISLVIDQYGTAGDPTRNVTVTNWPDWMLGGNVKETIFGDTLVLVGGWLSFVSGSGEGILIQHDTPLPRLHNVSSGTLSGDVFEYIPVLDCTFTQVKYPIKQYNISKKILGSLHIQFKLGGAGFPMWIRGVLRFGKIFQNGSSSMIFSRDIATLHGNGNNDWYRNYEHLCAEPLTIDAGERLYVNIDLEAQWDGEIGCWGYIQIVCTENEDDFMLVLPITET